MKAIYVQPGDTLDYVNTTSSAIDAGTIIIYGARAAVAAATIPPGETGAITLTGAFEVPKATGEITAGAVVYYDAESDKATTTAQDNTVIGIAAYAATSSDETVIVRLNG